MNTFDPRYEMRVRKPARIRIWDAIGQKEKEKLQAVTAQLMKKEKERKKEHTIIHWNT